MKKIILIPGDGIGPEIVAAARRILDKAAAKQKISFEFAEKYAGGAALDKFGLPLPADTIAACAEADATLLGAVGGPKWDNAPPELRAEKAILGLRKEMGLYINLRPIRVQPALAGNSPLKEENVAGADLLIVRELTGGIYFGKRREAFVDEETIERAWDIGEYSAPEIERVVRYAMRAALSRKKKVTSVDKSNVLASSRLWKKIAARTALDFPEVRLENMYVDNCAMQLILTPKAFDVIVTSNLFGDILSDEAAVITGSIGMLPSASVGQGPGLFEPIHGSAPDIAGLGIANPLGAILSAAMLLRFSLREEAAAAAIEGAVDKVLAMGYRTADIYGAGFTKVTTEEMGALVEKELA
ncbi:MAG: 3-isopropylmalate dehydrogenase [Acidaminococcales bacterium]|jgi:3-isopropylmalate dehydrogenase|nr:3-isopropylmalate dehydrogenase [Acidaminococcales bacterium]